VSRLTVLLLAALALAGCGGAQRTTSPSGKGIVVNDGEGDAVAPAVLRWGIPRPHGFGTKAWDVPVIVAGLPRDEAERAAANVIIDVRGGAITSGWCSGWGAYTCFGLPTPSLPQCSMSWLTGWGLVRMSDGEMACVVVNPTGGPVTVTLAVRGGLPRFYWRVQGEANYREMPMTISGPRTMTIGELGR